MHSWWWCWFKIVSGGFIIKLSRYTDFLLPRSGWITTCSCMLSAFLFFRRNDQNTSQKIRLPRVRMCLLGRLRKTDAKRLKSDHVNQYIFKKLQNVSLGQCVEDFWRWVSVSTSGDEYHSERLKMRKKAIHKKRMASCRSGWSALSSRRCTT